MRSWFLLRQTREKPLRATICFSAEHAEVHCAPCDAFDVNFICQLIFHLKWSLCTKECKFLTHQKYWQKKGSKPSSKCTVYMYIVYLVCGLHVKPKFKAFLPSLVRDCSAHWTQHSKQQLFETIRVSLGYKCDRKQVCKSSFKQLDVIKVKSKQIQSTRGRIPATYRIVSRESVSTW